MHPNFSLFLRFIISCMQRTQQFQIRLSALQRSKRTLLLCSALHYARPWFSQMVSQLAGQMFCTRTLLQRHILIVAGDRTLFYAKKENILRLIHIKRRTLSQQNCKKIGGQCTKDSLWGLDYRHLIKRERHCLSKTPIDPYILSIPHTLLHC